MNTERYTFRVRWSAEDEAYVGTVAELPSLSWVASDRDGALAGVRQLVADAVVGADDSEGDGEREAFMARRAERERRRDAEEP